MQTPYDWITVAIFAGLIVVFLHRSVGDSEPEDTIWHYLPPSVGCAVSNYLGNEAVENGSTLFHMLAIAGIIGVLAYIHFIIKPIRINK